MPHFFQIIIQDGEGMRQNRLRIPRKFMSVYGYGISKYVQVKDPRGKSWNLEWSKCDGDTWFKKRWEEFADYYSLGHGHLVVFKYEGNSQFSLVIFDKTATDIEYPVATAHGVEEVKEETDDNEDSRNQSSYDSSPRLPRKRENSPEKSSCRPLKEVKTPITGVFANQKCVREGSIQQVTAVMGERKFEVIAKAADFTSKYPYFSCVMQPSYVSPKSVGMYLPFRFFRNNLGCSLEHGTQVLLYSNGKCWKLRLALEINYSRVKLSTGWGKFAEDNNLQAGDSCVFELISQDEIKFNVHIFPLDANPGDCSSSGKQKQFRPRKDAESETDRRHNTQSDVPFFEFVMRPSFVNSGSMIIPADFARDHDVNEGVKKITLLVGDRSWKVTYMKPYTIYAWSFVHDNCLEAGDTCIFRLIGDDLFEVEIQKRY